MHTVLDKYSTWSNQVKGKGKSKAKAAPDFEDDRTPESPRTEASSSMPISLSETSSELMTKAESPLLKPRSAASPITEEFGEFILADLKEVLEQSEKSDNELSAFEALRKEEEFTEYQTPDALEGGGEEEDGADDDDEKNGTAGDSEFPEFQVVGDLGATTGGSSEDRSGLLIKNVFEIPPYDADVTVEMQQEIEQKVKSAALDGEDTILEVIVEEREVMHHTTDFIFLRWKQTKSFLFARLCKKKKNF